MSFENLLNELGKALQGTRPLGPHVPAKLGGYYETVDGLHVGPLMENTNCKCHPWRSRGDKYAPDAFKRELTLAEIAALPPWTPLDVAHETLQMTLVLLSEAMELAIQHKDTGMAQDLDRTGAAIDELLQKDNPIYAKKVKEHDEQEARQKESINSLFKSAFGI
jgi:hypothetical protein